MSRRRFSTSGALSGIPTQAGSVPVTITVTDSAKPANSTSEACSVYFS
jgi:hypothetical protein